MLVVRPKISKTIVKGTFLILIFSIFLNVSEIENFIAFLLISFSLLLSYSSLKYLNYYEIEETYIVVHNLLSTKRIEYSEIEDGFLSQGLLARKFNCGSIYIVLKGGKGVKILKDIPEPEKIEEVIKQRIT
jgi:hypothetical protein